MIMRYNSHASFLFQFFLQFIFLKTIFSRKILHFTIACNLFLSFASSLNFEYETLNFERTERIIASDRF